MQKTFIFNPSTSSETIFETLYEKTAQVKAVVNCLLLAIMSTELDENIMYDAVWAVDSLIEQIQELQQNLEPPE